MLLFFVSCKQDPKPVTTTPPPVEKTSAKNQVAPKKYPAINQNSGAPKQPVLINSSQLSNSKMKAMKRMRKDTSQIDQNK